MKLLRSRPGRGAGTTRLLSVLAVLGLAVAITGCNVNWGPYAARVNNKQISPATLNAAMSALKADPGFVCLEFGTTFRAAGAGEHTYDVQSADFVLNQLIEDGIERQIAVSLGAAPPPSAVSLASVQLTSRLESQLSAQTTSSCPKSGPDLSKLGAAYKNLALGLLATEDAIAAHFAGTSLSPASLATYEAAHPSTTSESCISLIEVTSKAEATGIEQAIKGGASFATEAADNSIDTSNAKQGGALGCAPSLSSLGPYAKPVEALSVNQVTAPLSYASGGTTLWLLFTVTSRPPESTATLLEQLLSTERAPFVASIEHAVSNARVSISSQYGTWKKVGEIVPPSTAASRYAPDPTAAIGPALNPPTSGTAPASSSTTGG